MDASSALKNLRLLIVADSSTTHTHRWAQWAAAEGAQVTVLSPFKDPIKGVGVIQFPARRWYHRIPKVKMVLDYLPFQSLIKQIDPQLIHFHFVSEGGRAFYWNQVKVPMIASTWGQDVIFDKGPDPKAQASLRKMLGKCRLITATTHQLARETARYTDASTPIHVIPFGVDITRFSPIDQSQISNLKSQIRIGFVKWLKPKYGPDIAIEAFAKIHAQRPNTKLVLAGKGEMREQLERRIAELKLQAAVEILGRVDYDKVPDLIRSFDIMLMPSIYESETFGVAAIEASACGVPVIASRVGGVPEAVLHNQTGILVPPRDIDALAAACIDLIDQPERRRAMGETGRRFVEKYYAWPDNCRLMGEIYRAALNGSQPRGVPIYQAGHEPDLIVPQA